jgi:N,N'-diacetylchitobiose transport system permease protein
VRRKDFLVLAGPAVVLMAALLLVPLVTTLVWSFQNVPVGRPGTFTGLANYRDLLGSPRFRDAAAFTVGFAVVATALKVVLGYALALLLTRVRRGRTVLLGFLLASYIVPSVVGALDFSWMFNDVFGGIVNRGLDVVGVRVDWLVETWPARALVVLHSLWHEVPFVVLVLLAGLQTLPPEPLEAASIDGAGWWQKQRYLVVPALAPVFSFALLISLMDGLKVFDSIRIMTPAAQQLGTESLMTYVYQVALGDSFRLGAGSAVNVLTMVVTLVLLIPFLRSTWKGARAL